MIKAGGEGGGGVPLVCDGGGQTKFTFEKPKNKLNLEHFTPEDVLNPKIY